MHYLQRGNPNLDSSLTLHVNHRLKMALFVAALTAAAAQWLEGFFQIWSFLYVECIMFRIKRRHCFLFYLTCFCVKKKKKKKKQKKDICFRRTCFYFLFFVNLFYLTKCLCYAIVKACYLWGIGSSSCFGHLLHLCAISALGRNWCRASCWMWISWQWW